MGRVLHPGLQVGPEGQADHSLRQELHWLDNRVVPPMWPVAASLGVLEYFVPRVAVPFPASRQAVNRRVNRVSRLQGHLGSSRALPEGLPAQVVLCQVRVAVLLDSVIRLDSGAQVMVRTPFKRVLVRLLPQGYFNSR